MSVKYLTDLFTEKTWEEFLKNGANISGFTEKQKTRMKNINRGDYLLCYVKGNSSIVGVLKVRSEYYYDNTPIWEDEDYPYRMNVELLYSLPLEESFNLLENKEHLSIFQNENWRNTWMLHFRGSLKELPEEDGKFIVSWFKKQVGKVTYEDLMTMIERYNLQVEEEYENLIKPNPKRDLEILSGYVKNKYQVQKTSIEGFDYSFDYYHTNHNYKIGSIVLVSNLTDKHIQILKEHIEDFIGFQLYALEINSNQVDQSGYIPEIDIFVSSATSIIDRNKETYQIITDKKEILSIKRNSV